MSTSYKAQYLVIDGLDGSGKGTIKNIISKKLSSIGYNVLTISFPQYQTFLGRKLKSLLKHDNGLNIEQRMGLYALNRLEVLESILTRVKNSGEFTALVFDRYPTSNIITLAYFLCKEQFENTELELVKDALLEMIKNKSVDLKYYKSIMDDQDSPFYLLLGTYDTKISIPIIDPQISIKSLAEDATREVIDTYEQIKVQLIAYYLYLEFAKIDSRFEIVEQIENGKRLDPEKVADKVLKGYNFNKLQNSGTEFDLEIVNPIISLDIKSQMEQVKNKYNITY